MHRRFMQDYQQIRPLILAIFTDVLGMALILPILPVLAVQYQINSILLGFLIASNAIFSFIFSPLYGKLSDQHGRRPVMLLCQVGTLCGFILLCFSKSIWLLLFARIIDGCFGGQVPTSQAIISDQVPPHDRGQLMTVIGGTYTFAYIFGPSMGGFAYQIYGMIGLGLLATIIATFNLVYSSIYLVETHPDKIVQKPSWMEQPQTNTINSQTQSSNSVLSLLNNKSTLYLLGLYALFILTASPFETTISLFSYLHAHFSIAHIGLLFTAMALFQVSFRLLLFTRIHNKLGDAKSVIVGFGIYITAYVFLGFNFGIGFFVFSMCYLTLAAVFTRGIIVSYASQSVDEKSQGKLMGLTTSIENIGQIGGPF